VPLEGYLIAMVIGFLAGLHTSTWGMYKDAPYEGFSFPRYFRSAIVGALVGPLVYPLANLDLTSAGGMVVFFGLCYVCERGLVEFWKTFLREEDQSKYFIPMQFAVMGKPVQSRRTRIIVGCIYAGVVLAIVGAVELIDRLFIENPSIVLLVLVGTIGGWISAFGGAWKDAPVEGFETFKFFRSPIISGIYAFLMTFFTDRLILVLVPALGYTIATIETYKTFFFPSKPRGKFAGKPIQFPEMMTRRYRFVPVYASIWLAVLVTFVVAFTS
jgi:hypothetical protein